MGKNVEFVISKGIGLVNKKDCLVKYLNKLISDERLKYVPVNDDIDIKDNKVIINYRNGMDYLTINVKCGGTTYYDNCVDYFYKMENSVYGSMNTNWNEVLTVINRWHLKNAMK